MVPILHDVNLHVGEGKILGLVGESGSGKSMTAFAVTRLLPGEEKAELDGSIRLCGRQLLGISRKSMEEVRGAGRVHDISGTHDLPESRLYHRYPNDGCHQDP